MLLLRRPACLRHGPITRAKTGIVLVWSCRAYVTGAGAGGSGTEGFHASTTVCRSSCAASVSGGGTRVGKTFLMQ
jgi:hypothetical protein